MVSPRQKYINMQTLYHGECAGAKACAQPYSSPSRRSQQAVQKHLVCLANVRQLLTVPGYMGDSWSDKICLAFALFQFEPSKPVYIPEKHSPLAHAVPAPRACMSALSFPLYRLE